MSKSTATKKSAPKKTGQSAAQPPKFHPNGSGKKLDIFEIELMPPPVARSLPLEKVQFTEKLERTLPNVPVGAAFIIEKKFQNFLKTYLRDKLPMDVFRFVKIQDNNRQIRVYRIAREKK